MDYLEWTPAKQQDFNDRLKRISESRIELYNSLVPQSVKFIFYKIFTPAHASCRTVDRIIYTKLPFIGYSKPPYKDKYIPFLPKSEWNPAVLLRLEKMLEEGRQTVEVSGAFTTSFDQTKNDIISSEQLKKEFIKSKQQYHQNSINFLFDFNSELSEILKKNPSLSK